MQNENEGRVPVVEIDVSQVTTARELHQLLKVNLNFPDFYGMNWDAFWDAITGLVETPEILIVKGWSNVEDNLPKDAKSMKFFLNELNKKYPRWGTKVIYD